MGLSVGITTWHSWKTGSVSATSGSMNEDAIINLCVIKSFIENRLLLTFRIYRYQLIEIKDFYPDIQPIKFNVIFKKISKRARDDTE